MYPDMIIYQNKYIYMDRKYISWNIGGNYDLHSW